MADVLAVTNYIVYIVAGSLGGVTAYFTIRNEMRKAKKEQREWFENTVSKQTSQVVKEVNDELKVYDERFRVTDIAATKNKEDIADIETDIKTMTNDLKDICNKLARHDYVVDEVLPEYKTLKEEFYKFKSSVDANLFHNGPSKTVSYSQANSSDQGNRQNIDREGNIQG